MEHAQEFVLDKEESVFKTKYVVSEMDKTCRVAGKVFIVDPCYVICDWHQFCHDSLDAIQKYQAIKVESPYGTFFVTSTAYSDGSYPVYKAGKFVGEAGVDAGLLSVIPMEVFDKIVSQDDKALNEKWGKDTEWIKNELGVVVEAEGPVEMFDGNIDIISEKRDNIQVNTSEEEDEDEDEDEENFDDEDEDCGCDDCDDCDCDE